MKEAIQGSDGVITVKKKKSVLELQEEIERHEEFSVIISALAKTLPSKEPDRAKLEQIASKHAKERATKEVELRKLKQPS